LSIPTFPTTPHFEGLTVVKLWRGLWVLGWDWHFSEWEESPLPTNTERYWKLSFTADLIIHNEFNLRWQGETACISDMHTAVKAFRQELVFFESRWWAAARTYRTVTSSGKSETSISTQVCTRQPFWPQTAVSAAFFRPWS
jgi:hypothetical protein